MKTALAFLLLAGSVTGMAAAPLVIAHRGASGYLPEHTLAAKGYAHALGADFLEQDLVLSKDNVPVVLHDLHLDAVSDVAAVFPGRARADGRFYALDFTVAELKQLRLRERVNLKTGAPAYPKRYDSVAAPGDFRIATLEEELQFIRALGRSTGRTPGIYPELKQPRWHREQGRDLAAAVLPILARYGYATKDAPCFLQCFEPMEVRRLRGELGWRGRIVLLLGGGATADDGTEIDRICTAAGLKEWAALIDGIGPAVSRIVRWNAAGESTVSSLVADAHAAGLVVHPYTFRRDDLPPGCPSADAFHAVVFGAAKADGLFSDFPDVTLRAAGR